MIGRPMTGLAVVWLAGLLFAKLKPDSQPFLFLFYYTILFIIFILYSKRQPDWLNSYVLPKRYPQMTIYLVLLPCLFVAGFFCMKEAERKETAAYMPWKEQEALGEKNVFVYGTVKEKRYEDRVVLVLEECELVEADEKNVPAGNCQVTVESEGKAWLPEVQIGNRICVYGKFSTYRPATNPGQFDAYSYYVGKDLFASVKAMRIEVVSEHVDPVGQGMFLLRQRLRESLVSLYPEEKAGVLAAMILGDKDLLPEEVKELYQQNGISHILAISGLHISMLCMGLFREFRRLGCPIRLAAGVSAVFLLFYIAFTGGSTSSMRAGIMCLVMIGGKLLRRSYDLLSALSFAAILVTAVRPMEITSAGFLLSFGAVLGVALSSAVLAGVMRRKLYATFLHGALIQCTTLPISLWFYYELSPYSVLLNLLVLPLVSLILGGGILSMLLWFLSPTLGRLAAGGVYVLLEFYEQLGLWTQKLPFSFVLVGKPAVWQMVLYYGLLGVGLWMFLRGSRIVVPIVENQGCAAGCPVGPGWSLSASLFLGVLCLLFPVSQPPELLFLDVSQGDGALIFTEEGNVILSDCGSSDVSGVGEYRLSPAMKEKGISVIDMAIVSHMDSDHISGIQELLEEMPVWKDEFSFRASYSGDIAIRELVLPRVQKPSETYLALVHMAEQKNVAVRYVEAGEVLYREEDLLLECLWPATAQESENDTSIVFLLQTEKLAVWFMGDAGVSPEEEIMKRLAGMGFKDVADLTGLLGEKLVVLKVGHHGSKTSSGEAFVRYVNPDVAVISCGYQNSYGHPHDSVLAVFEREGSQVLRTDEIGAVRIEMGKERIFPTDD